jgi:hypothetical protein
MNKTALPPQFSTFINHYKARTWKNLVTVDIPALLNQHQTSQTQNQNLQDEVTTRGNRIQVLETQIAAQQAAQNAQDATPNPIADSVYGPPGQILDAVEQREEVIIDVTDVQQGQYLLSMESLVSGMVDIIRNRVTDSLPGRLRAWLALANERKRVAVRAPGA